LAEGWIPQPSQESDRRRDRWSVQCRKDILGSNHCKDEGDDDNGKTSSSWTPLNHKPSSSILPPEVRVGMTWRRKKMMKQLMQGRKVKMAKEEEEGVDAGVRNGGNY